MSGMKSFLGFHCQTPPPEKWKLFSQVFDNKRIISLLGRKLWKQHAESDAIAGDSGHPRGNSLGWQKVPALDSLLGEVLKPTSLLIVSTVFPLGFPHTIRSFLKTGVRFRSGKTGNFYLDPLKLQGKKVSCPSRGFPPEETRGFLESFQLNQKGGVMQV